MENIPKVKIVFFIYGLDLEPEEITEILNIKPSVSKRKGEFPANSIAKPFWTLDTDWIQTYAISEVFQQLVNILEKKEELIKKVVAKYNYETRFTVNIWMKDLERPEMMVDREIICFANRINADIGFDLFFD